LQAVSKYWLDTPGIDLTLIVTNIAYKASEKVFSFQPALAVDSDFSTHLKQSDKVSHPLMTLSLYLIQPKALIFQGYCW
jgi:hypothetical protein